jgi:hypothetical protein
MAHDILHPTWIDLSAFPFAAHTFHHPEGRMHYVDEGSGPVILFEHPQKASICFSFGL